MTTPSPLISLAVQTIQRTMPRHELKGDVKGSVIYIVREDDGTMSADVYPVDKDGDGGTGTLNEVPLIPVELEGEMYLAAQLLLSAGLDSQAGLLPEGGYPALKLFFEASEQIVTIQAK